MKPQKITLEKLDSQKIAGPVGARRRWRVASATNLRDPEVGTLITNSEADDLVADQRVTVFFKPTPKGD